MLKIRPVCEVARRGRRVQGVERAKYRVSHNRVMQRMPISAGRRDAFRRFNAVSTGTPWRLGVRRYSRTTNPDQRFVECFQYGSSVRPVGRELLYYVWWKRQVESFFDKTTILISISNLSFAISINQFQYILVKMSKFLWRFQDEWHVLILLSQTFTFRLKCKLLYILFTNFINNVLCYTIAYTNST